MKTIYDVYFAVSHCFINMFHLQQSQGILDSFFAQIPVARTENKVKAISIHLIRKKFPSFQTRYYLPTKKT